MKPNQDEYIKKETLISIFEAKADMALGSPKHFFLSMAEMVRKLPAADVIVPPCNVGQTVYAISESRIAECRVDEICIYGNEKIIMTDHTCDYDCKGCPFSSWGQDYSGEHSCQGEYGTYSFAFEDFGKTVFLTREEAEKALAEREGKG